MYRNFKFSIRLFGFSVLIFGLSSFAAFGYLSRREAFEQSFDMVWNTVHESHWDESFGGLDWEAVRDSYRPKVKRIRKRADLVMLLQKMLDELELSHFKVISNFAEAIDTYPRGGYVGIHLKYLDGQAYVTRVDPDSPSAQVGIKTGWCLKSIHRRSVKRLIAPYLRSKLSDKQKSFYIQRYLNDLIQGGTGLRIRTDWYPPDSRAVKVYMEPKYDDREQSNQFGHLPTQKIEFHQLQMESGMLYIRFNYFLPKLMPELRNSIESAAEEASGVILDLRGNTGGLTVVAVGLSGLLVDERTVLGELKMKNGHISYQAYPQVTRFEGPVAILVDVGTVSTSEMLAAGLQESGRARIFGETTLGESLPSLMKKLPSGDVLQYAVGDYRTPGGYRIEKNGVVPDEVIIPGIEQLELGLDLPLQKAAEWIKSQKKVEPSYAD